jgi:hypothetical protein
MRTFFSASDKAGCQGYADHMQIRPGFRRFDGKKANTGSDVQKMGSILKEGAETGARQQQPGWRER